MYEQKKGRGAPAALLMAFGNSATASGCAVPLGRMEAWLPRVTVSTEGTRKRQEG